MTDALFVTFEAGGNVPPMLGIAQRLIADGGTALLLGSPSQRRTAEAAGVPFEPFSHDQDYDPLHPVSLPANLSQLVRTLADPRMAQDVLVAARRISPRVVVVDCMLLGVLDAAVRAGLNTVTLVHTLPSFWATYARGPVGLVATLRRLRPGRVWASAAGSLATVLPGFDAGPAAAFADLQAIGPVTPLRGVEPVSGAGPNMVPVTGTSREPRGTGGRHRPRVLISLSTNWFPGQEKTLQRLLDAVGGLDVDAVVTTGRSTDPRSVRAPANAELHQTIDHDLLLPAVDLLVGHGGHGTTMRALAHDVPVLVVPSFAFADQPQVGRRLQATGAGRTMPSSSSTSSFQAAIRVLSGPGGHRDAAATLGRQTRSLDPAGAAVAYLMTGSSTRSGSASRPRRGGPTTGQRSAT